MRLCYVQKIELKRRCSRGNHDFQLTLLSDYCSVRGKSFIEPGVNYGIL